MIQHNHSTNVPERGRHDHDKPPYRMVFVTALVFTVTALTVLIYNDWRSYRDFRQTILPGANFTETVGTIVQLDEALTMSARMAALTGDPQWEQRYWLLEPQLDSAIQKAEQTAPDFFVGELARQTDKANRALVEMEIRSFDLAHRGQRVAANTLLASPEYTVEKRAYARGFEQMRAALRERDTARLAAMRRELLLSLVFSGTTIPLLLLAWFVVIRMIRKRDVDRKRVEEDLRESESKFHSIASHTPDHIIIQDLDLRYTYVVNPQLGLRGSDMIGKTDQDILSKEDAEKLTAVKRRVLRTGQVASLETSLKNDEGKDEHFEGSYIPRLGANSEPIGLIGYFRNITQRKSAEEALQESEERFRSIAEHLNDVLFTTNNDGVITYLSPSTYRLFDYTSEEMTGRHFTEFLLEEDIHKAAEHFRLLITDADNSENLELCMRRKDGGVFTGELNASALRKNNETIGAIGIIRNITERKKTEETLRLSEEKFRKTFMTSPDAININRLTDGMYVSINHGFAETMGYSEEDILGKTSLEMNIWDDPADRAALVEGLKRDGMVENLIARFRARNGSIVYGMMSASIIELEGVKHILSITRNISERMRADEALQNSEGRLRAITETIADTILQSDRSGRITFVNHVHPGLTTDSVLSATVFEFVPPEQRPVVEKALNAAFLHGESSKYESLGPGPVGETRTYDVSVSPIFVGSQVNSAVFLARDITERKRMEEQLRLSEQTYKGILDSISEAVYIEGADGIFLDVNRAAEQMYGYAKEEFVGRTPEFLSAPGKNDLSKLGTYLEKALNGEPQSFEFWGRRKDGTIFPKDVSNSLGYYFGKKVNIAVARDISERKQAEEALHHAQKMESIGTLAGGIAHDFNNLLSAILGQTSLALGKLPPESTASSNLIKATKAAERAADLTRQLLAYSGKGKFATEEIDLSRLVEENAQLLEVSIPKSTELRYDLGSSPTRVQGDVGQIQQVIMNLIINAGEAMGVNPGRINVRTGQIGLTQDDKEYWKYTAIPLAPGKYALLKVSDNGGGMSQETLNRIFDPFYTTKFTGRGLGLAAVLGIVRGHNGGIRIQSDEGKGTEFEIVFPFVESQRATESQKSRHAATIVGDGKTVLVIDDEPSVLELLTDMFTDAKFAVMSASNPMEGIDLYRRHHERIAIVILDYSMPGMDGKAAFEEIIKININAKVILCSGYTEEETASVFGLVRPTGFIQKPYKPAELLERVATMTAVPPR